MDASPSASTEHDLGLFRYWHRHGFTSELLPAAAWDARGPDGLPIADPGKRPARRRRDGWWCELREWKDRYSSEEQIRRWASWNGNVGLRARRYPACDVDVYDKAVAEACAGFCLDRLGPGPIRRGQDPKCLIVYAGSIRKRRLDFRLHGDERLHTVEFLGDRKQYVVDGVHPKTRRPYRWDEDIRPVPGGLQTIDQAAVEDCLAALEHWLVETFEASIVLGSGERFERPFREAALAPR